MLYKYRVSKNKKYVNARGRYNFNYERHQDIKLESGYYVSQTWTALRKAWIGFRIAKTRNEKDNLVKYAKIIQKLQKQLGFEPDDFSHLGIK